MYTKKKTNDRGSVDDLFLNSLQMFVFLDPCG